MKNTIGRLLFWLNYILVILYMAHQVSRGQTIIESSVAILISSLMLIDSTYISACNIRDNKVITLFCGGLHLYRTKPVDMVCVNPFCADVFISGKRI